MIDKHVLTAETLIIGLGDRPLPITITLQSTEVSRKIQISTDNGSNYFDPALDVTVTAEIILVLKAPATHVKVTGATADILTILSGRT
jgi:hypothetical protein